MSDCLRFVSYNVHGFVGRGGRYLPEQTIEVMQQLDADVIALQEILGDDRHGLTLLRRFSTENGYHLILGPTIRQSLDHQYGNALLLQSPPEEIELHDISVRGREPRGVIECGLDLQGEPWKLFATHLGLSPRERRQQIERLREIMEIQDHPNMALMGDINEWCGWRRAVRRLRNGFISMPHPATFPACLPCFSLDRIWLRAARHSVRLAVCRSPLCRRASDHLPLIAEIQPFD